MAQTLTAQTTISGTISLSTGKTLMANIAAIANIDGPDLFAVRVVDMIAEVDQNVSTTYATNHQQLIADSLAFTAGIETLGSDTMLNRAFTAAEWGAAKVVASSLSTDVNTLLASGKDFRSLPVETLQRILIYLRARNAA